MPDPFGFTPVARRSVAGIVAFRDRDRLLAALGAEFGVAVPTTPRLVRAGPVTLSCLAPGRYLASADPDSDLAGRLAGRLAGLAAITDQSDMWEGWALSGRLAVEVLARLVPIDLAPAAFRVGDLALTRAGHLDVRLWRMAELGYELAVSRSHASELNDLLELHAKTLSASDNE